MKKKTFIEVLIEKIKTQIAGDLARNISEVIGVRKPTKVILEKPKKKK